MNKVRDRQSIKRLEAVIRPEKLEPLRQHLEKVGYPGMMVTDIEGNGRQGGVVQQWRGVQFKRHFLAKVRVVIVVPAQKVNALVKAILDVCCDGQVGDGKIFISDVNEVIRIRTQETGLKAVG